MGTNGITQKTVAPYTELLHFKEYSNYTLQCMYTVETYNSKM